MMIPNSHPSHKGQTEYNIHTIKAYQELKPNGNKKSRARATKGDTECRGRPVFTDDRISTPSSIELKTKKSVGDIIEVVISYTLKI